MPAFKRREPSSSESSSETSGTKRETKPRASSTARSKAKPAPEAAAKPAASPALETAALEQWLAPSTSSSIDQVDLTLIDDGWEPERVGQAPLDATLAAIQAVGVVEPVLLRPREGGRFEVVTGHRTVAAARHAGMQRVPSVVKDLGDAGALMALVFDGSASGQVTASGAAELRRRLAASGAAEEDIEDVMAAVPVAPVPAEELAPVAEPVEAAVAAAEAAPAAVEEEFEAAPVPQPAEAATPEIAPPEPVPVEAAPAEPVPVEAVEEAVEAAPEPEPVLAAVGAPEPEPILAAVGTVTPDDASSASTHRWLPLPAGRPRLARLSSAFADAPRMLRILASDRFTGTAELVGRDGRKDAVAYLDGRILATYTEQGEHRVDAPLRLPSPDNGPTVEITVRPHPRAVSVALALALRSPARFTGLHAAFLHLDGLLDLLRREGSDAACVVTSGKGSGVILLDAGQPIAAYARRWGDEPSEEAETTDVSAVLDMLVSGEGSLDVHTGDVPEPLDLDDVIARSVAGD